MILKDSKGYTLIELVVVSVLIGLTLTITFPRLRNTLLTDGLKGSTRELVGTIRSLRGNAIREHRSYLLYFDLESNVYWIEHDDMDVEERARAREGATSLRGGVKLKDVWSSTQGKRMSGEAAIRFSPKGYIQQSLIHLESEDDREFTIVLRPILRRIRVLDEYAEFEDLSIC